MSDLYGLKLEPMPNRLVNYGVTTNGIAVIELTSDSAGAPLEGANDRSPNTYTHGMMCDIDTAIVKARFDDDVTCIVLTGNGASFFSAGASIQMLNSVTPGFKYNFCLHANETLSRLEQTSKLVVCAINGHAVGGGLEIAMAADIRIARKNAGKVGLPEINLGVLAGTGGTARLTRLIGKAMALEMMVTGELMSFEDAHGKAQQKISAEIFSIGAVNSLFQTRQSRLLETSSVPAKPVQKFHSNTTWLSNVSCKRPCSTAVMLRKELQPTSKSVLQTSLASD
jgi:hypothetical protein